MQVTQDCETAETQEAGRFEFRVWADRLAALARRLATSAEARDLQDTREIYALLPRHPDVNVKIRDGALEVKLLVEHRESLERWRPHLEERFPIAHARMLEAVLPLLEMSSARIGTEAMTLGGFLAWAADRQPWLVTVPLRKHRQRYRFRACRAEHVRVELPWRTVETVAVEAEDPQAVRDAVADLGLDAAVNLSYPSALLRAIARNGSEDGERFWDAR